MLEIGKCSEFQALIELLKKLISYFRKDKKNNKKYKIIIAPPFTLLHDFSKKFKNKKIIISAQNCYHKDNFGAQTGNVSPFMIKSLGVKYIILGHSEIGCLVKLTK